MDLGQNRVTPPTANADVDLEEIVDMIRAGDPAGLKQFQRVFSPGVRFLIERKLGKTAVETEARSVLEAALQVIRSDRTVEGRTLPRLVRRLILERAEHQHPLEKADTAPAASPEGVHSAESVVEQMSPVEREALRRCYVLGEQPEVIAQKLGLNPDELQAIQSRARAEFLAANSRQTNVA